MKNEFWLNLPVKDLKKSKDFFTQLGFSFKDAPKNLLSLLVGKQDVVINLFEETEFKGYSGNEIADTKNATEVLFNIGAENKEAVDQFAEKIKKAGGEIYRGPEDKDGWMYGCGFTDLDGHRWSMLYMDMSKMPKE
ncbi:VOC family protein [Flavobacterium sp.]|uniref:VOC family protein n=1 Tax=Flavobacterium sp. TaxID=239 RepID=UPI00286CFCC8|nr:VOC family protein [Flavobacterium sp.]